MTKTNVKPLKNKRKMLVEYYPTDINFSFDDRSY